MLEQIIAPPLCCNTMFPCKLLLRVKLYFSLIWLFCNELAFCSIIVPLSFMELSLLLSSFVQPIISFPFLTSLPVDNWSIHLWKQPWGYKQYYLTLFVIFFNWKSRGEGTTLAHLQPEMAPGWALTSLGRRELQQGRSQDAASPWGSRCRHFKCLLSPEHKEWPWKRRQSWALIANR